MQGAHENAEDCGSEALFEREVAWSINACAARRPIQEFKSLWNVSIRYSIPLYQAMTSYPIAEI